VLRNKAVTIGFLASMLLPLVAHAQGGSQGSILGYVFDQTGNPIPGVKVIASSYPPSATQSRANIPIRPNVPSCAPNAA